MAAVPRLPLPEFFQTFTPAYVLGTTYTVSLAFFEGLVFPKIDRSQLRRCLVLCDQVGFQRALVEASALHAVGREYLAVCAPATHSFHPKVWLMIGEDAAALLVGSGNLTQSGFRTNLELFDAVQLTQDGPYRILAGDILHFLDGLIGLWAGTGNAGLLVVDTLSEMRKAMQELSAGMSAEEAGGIRFLTNFGGPLWEQFKAFFEGGTLHVAAPYFGGSVSGLRSLRETLNLQNLKVFPGIHAGEAIDVPLEDVTAIPGTTAHRLALSSSSPAFAHLKMYGCEGPHGRWLFTTSANCTEAALGGMNVEAGLMRPVSRADLKTYFAEDRTEPLPTKQRPAQQSTSTRWLAFTATNQGSAIELVAANLPELSLPLSGVRLALQFGSQSFERQAATLFAHGPRERVAWSLFPDLRDTTGGSLLLKIQAKGADGNPIMGAAFVDQPLLLTSDPVHRSAWRATLAILDREGLPEAADLACVFHLVQDLFEPAADVSGDDGGQRPASSEHSKEEVDKIPIWPPVSNDVTPSHLHAGREQTTRWFQKILSELLGRTQAATSVVPSVSTSVDHEEDPDAEPSAPLPALVRAARSVWGPAASSYEWLIDHLNSTQITGASARKIWPISVAILLATLATRKQIVRRVPDAKVPAVAELVRRFLHALFADRSQGWRHGLDDDDSIGPTDPSVASILHETYKVNPPKDIAGVLHLLFAFQHTYAPFLDGWLLFREIGPEELAVGPPPEESATLYRRYLSAESEGIDWPRVSASWEAVSRLDWPDHPGFQELRELVCRAEGRCERKSPLPAPFRDLWGQTERRLRTDKPWCCKVSRLHRYCTAQGCPLGYTLDPTKRGLAQLHPVICRGCGSVLVPDRLAQAFEERK
jgi:hypothetical protein